MNVAVVGEALIDLIAGEGGAYRACLGGSPYNVAIGLARQGVGVSYLSALSDDGFGEQLYESLVGEGVAVPLERRSPWPTSLALVSLDDEGQPDYRLYRQGVADKDTSLDEIVGNLPEDLQVLHTGSLALTPSQLPKLRSLFGLMHERGVPVSVDINIRLRGSLDAASYLEGVRSILADADIVKASDEDLRALGLGSDARAAAQRAYTAMGSGILILTEGSGGAVLYGRRGTVAKSAYRVPAVADTVGAGDSFHAAFLATLIRELPQPSSIDAVPMAVLGRALDFACAAAAINVTRKGCSPPTAAEVEDFLNAGSD